MPRGNRPTRVLHVLGSLNPGGVENWLLNLLKRMNRDSVRMDFLVHTQTPGAYDREVMELGATIFRSEVRPLTKYVTNVRDILRKHGPYDVIHSHVNFFSGIPLFFAAMESIPVRISHSHTDTRREQRSATMGRRFYHWLMRGLVDKYSTHRLAASEPAAVSLFGGDWRNRVHTQVLHCGLDLAPFEEQVSRIELRATLGIPEHAFVVGHVGRFVPVKNHDFVLTIAAHMIGLSNDVYFLLLGDGPLWQSVRDRAVSSGLAERVILTGFRRDVASLLRAMDCLVLPSQYEGLGLAAVEAQVVGLRCVVADSVPREVEVIPGTVKWLSLQDAASVWASALFEAGRDSHNQDVPNPLELVRQSSFHITSSLEELLKLYLP